MSQQIFFDLDFGSSAMTAAARTQLWRQRQLLQRAVLRWCEEEHNPKGMAVDVVTRVSRFKADVAAFWSEPVRNSHEEGPAQILIPTKTVIVQCHPERDDCWPDCMRSNEILPQLRDAKKELQTAEEQIRREEPHLRESNTLFEEFAEWRYEDSRNREYHHLKHTIEKLEHGLYNGTKFERIRSAQLADYLYLAVPAEAVDPAELADGWGLLWIEKDLSVREVLAPEDRECLRSNRFHLIQNIAAAGKKTVLAGNGVRCNNNGEVIFTKIPRAHRHQEDVSISP